MATLPSNAYSFTVTLLPKLYRMDAAAQYDCTYLPVAQMLKSLSFVDYSKLSIVAELTKSCNIHYHGVFQLHNIDRIVYSHDYVRKRFIDAFRKHALFGFVHIKPIFDGQRWVEYMKKDIPTTKELVDRCPILLDSHEMIPRDELDV